MNSAARLYLAVEETSILHSAVWLIQLLVSVTHIFVPEPCLLLRWDLKQRPHLLLYCICREADNSILQHWTMFSFVRVGLLTDCVCFTEITRDRNVHVVIFAQVELKQVNFHLAVLDKHAMFNNLENQSYVQKSGLKRDKLIKHVDLPHLPDNGSLTIQAAVPADQFVPRLSWHKDIVQLIYQVLF